MSAAPCGPHCPKYATSRAACCQCAQCHGRPVVEEIKRRGKTGKVAEAFKKKHGKK